MQAEKQLHWYQELLGPGNFYLEIQENGIDLQKKVNRELINQRYRLLPYIYSTAYEATQSGLPVSRTLAINYSFDDQVYKPEYENEYLFGDNILVAPVVSTQQFAKVYLPAGGGITC